MKIAKVVSSNSHIAYVARILEERDGEGIPGPDDYGFGIFVSVRCDDENIIGVICDSRLMNPEYANFTPRLAETPALGDLRRDVSNEQKALIGILLLGSFRDGIAVQQIPQRLLPAGQFVIKMPPDEVMNFHKDANGSVQMHYFSNLIAQAGPLAIPLAKTIVDQLMPNCSEFDRQRLSVMSGSLAWKHTFGDIRF